MENLQFMRVLELSEQFLQSEPTDVVDVQNVSDALDHEAFSDEARNITIDQWNRIDVCRSHLKFMAEKILADKVKAQADQQGGWIDIPLMTKYGKPYGPMPKLRVPLYPFLIWTFRGNFNFKEHGIDLKWDYVAGQGRKMMNDDPAHTDWMLGAGVPLSEAYNHDDTSFGDIVRNSAYRHQDLLIKKYTNRQFTVLAGGQGRVVSGTIVHPKPGEPVAPGSIAVVPNAGPDYQFAMETANTEGSGGKRGLIICETGGKLAHLAVVGREYKCTVLMIPGALSLYKEDQSVWIDLKTGTIEHRVW